MEQELCRLANEQYPARCRQVLDDARRVMENTFLFDAPWDMEQTQTPYRFVGEIDWACRPADDPEWTYMLARHGFVLHLAQAYALCGDACFAQKAAALAEDFLRRVPITEETKETAWRSLDAAIRISNWLDAFDILSAAGAPTEAFCQTLRAGARLHADYLLSVDTPFCRLSNWGVIGNAGLYQAALFLRDEAAEAEALRRLADEVQLQIRTDGWQWEQSPMYHVEVLTALLRVVRLAAREERAIPACIPQAAERMCLALAQSKKPDHRQFMQSDSDDTDLRDVITQGALLLHSGACKAHGFAQPDFDSLFWATAEQVQRYAALCPAPLPLFGAHAPSGNYYLRTGWGETDSCIHFHCGTMGGGHGHADLLHIDLCALGRDVLVDSGRYTYVENAKSLWYKSCAAHNTFTVDGVPFTECTGTWDFGRCATPLPAACSERDGMMLAEGGHLGYFGLPDPVLCRRMVLLLDARAAFVLDVCHARGAHRYEGYFHFPDANGLALTETGARFWTEDIRTAIFFPGRKAAVSKTPLSRYYNLEEEKATLTLRCAAEGLCVMPAAFVSALDETPRASLRELPVFHAKSKTPLPSAAARAWQLTAGDDVWTLIFALTDTVGTSDFLQAGGAAGHGRVLVDKNGKTTALAW